MNSSATATGQGRARWPSPCCCCWWFRSCSSSASRTESCRRTGNEERRDEEVPDLSECSAAAGAAVPVRTHLLDDRVLLQQFTAGHGVGRRQLPDAALVCRAVP